MQAVMDSTCMPPFGSLNLNYRIVVDDLNERKYEKSACKVNRSDSYRLCLKNVRSSQAGDEQHGHRGENYAYFMVFLFHKYKYNEKKSY